MSQAPNIDGILIQWGDRLFYPSNRIVKTKPAPQAQRNCVEPTRRRDPRTHRCHRSAPRTAGDGQGYRWWPLHENHRRALSLHQQERPPGN